jgi:hypothetical protein
VVIVHGGPLPGHDADEQARSGHPGASRPDNRVEDLLHAFRAVCDVVAGTGDASNQHHVPAAATAGFPVGRLPERMPVRAGGNPVAGRLVHDLVAALLDVRITPRPFNNGAQLGDRVHGAADHAAVQRCPAKFVLPPPYPLHETNLEHLYDCRMPVRGLCGRSANRVKRHRSGAKEFIAARDRQVRVGSVC